MNLDYLLLFLLFPMAWPFIAKKIWSQTINWAEMGLHFAIPVVLITAVYFAGSYGATADTEIWNGQVTDKRVVDGKYVRTYQCRCRTVSSGSGSNRTTRTVCDTCYEDRYTRKYQGFSTVGNWTFDSIDTTSRSRRNSFGPPASYVNCRIGEPASREYGYTNYIRAVPESLFNREAGLNLEQFADMIPTYPEVYGFYKINRVLPVGVNMPNAGAINSQLNEALRTLGPDKEANIIVVVVNTDNPSYRYALEEAWIGGKKNDVIVIVGAPNFPQISWVDTITLGNNAGNSLMTVTMRDTLLNHGTIDNVFAEHIIRTIRELFDRKAMEDFAYLKDEIDPPTWVVIVSLILGIGGSLGLTLLFHFNEFFGTYSNRYYRRYR